MSQKITSKNLAYNAKLPPFLAALQAQASGASGPDPILSGRRRAAKKRSDSEEAEDAPLVVDEDGNTVKVELDKDGAVKDKTSEEGVQGQNAPAGKSAENADGGQLTDPKVTIGAKKRKVGKLIGDVASGDVDDSKEETGPRSVDTRATDSTVDGGGKRKKKPKKIKLSFDDG